MKPSLATGRVIHVTPRLRCLHGDVVGSHTSVKRVIGLAGDEVMVRSGEVILNGVPLPRRDLDDDFVEELSGDQVYRVTRADGMAANSPARRVPDGSGWVIGDNQGQSQDSWFYGAVKLSDVIGICNLI